VASVSFHPIANVIGVATDAKMGRVNTKRHVARMKHPFARQEWSTQVL
jgi:hypothetical protein